MPFTSNVAQKNFDQDHLKGVVQYTDAQTKDNKSNGESYIKKQFFCT